MDQSLFPRCACWLGLLGFLLVGCDEVPSPPEPDKTPATFPAGARFDPEAAGTVTGRVTWEGPVPPVPSFHAPTSPLSEHGDRVKHDWPNPHRPVVDAATRGLANTVVFLRGIDPARARAWDHPPSALNSANTSVTSARGRNPPR